MKVMAGAITIMPTHKRAVLSMPFPLKSISLFGIVRFSTLAPESCFESGLLRIESDLFLASDNVHICALFEAWKAHDTVLV